MNIFKVTTQNDTLIGYYESYDLADFHCTARLYKIDIIGVIQKKDMVKLVLDLKEPEN